MKSVTRLLSRQRKKITNSRHTPFPSFLPTFHPLITKTTPSQHQIRGSSLRNPVTGLFKSVKSVTCLLSRQRRNNQYPSYSFPFPSFLPTSSNILSLYPLQHHNNKHNHSSALPRLYKRNPPTHSLRHPHPNPSLPHFQTATLALTTPSQNTHRLHRKNATTPRTKNVRRRPSKRPRPNRKHPRKRQPTNLGRPRPNHPFKSRRRRRPIRSRWDAKSCNSGTTSTAEL